MALFLLPPVRVSQLFLGDTSSLILRSHGVDEMNLQPPAPRVDVGSSPHQSSDPPHLASVTGPGCACDLTQVRTFIGDVHGDRKALLTLALISYEPRAARLRMKTGRSYRRVLLKDGPGERHMCPPPPTHTLTPHTPPSSPDDFESLNLGKSQMLASLDFPILRTLTF